MRNKSSCVRWTNKGCDVIIKVSRNFDYIKSFFDKKMSQLSANTLNKLQSSIIIKKEIDI